MKLGDVLALAPLALDLQPQRIRSRYIGNGQVEGWTTPEGWHVLVPINIIHQPAGDTQADLRVILGDDYDPCR